MKQNYIIGVDISKSKIDCAVMNLEFELLKEKQVANTDSKIKAFLSGIFKELKTASSEVLICCENTGIYNRPLERVCKELGIDLWVEHALKIKRASTDMRGKTDRKDALRIAEYAVRYQDKQVLYQEPSNVIKELNRHIKIRETLIDQKVAIENQLREVKSHDPEAYKTLKEGYKAIVRALEKSILKTEATLRKLIQNDEEVSQNVELLISIPGIGMQNAINLMIATNNFKAFNSAKHLACYAGVVPFQNQSGTVVKRERISKMANKTIKKLLHMAALASVRFDTEIKAYYIRKVKEGKNKMSVLNAVRNKLIHRIMAVIARKTPYIVEKENSYQKGML